MTDDKIHADKFRELECQEDEAAFDEKARKVATAPKPEPEK